MFWKILFWSIWIMHSSHTVLSPSSTTKWYPINKRWIRLLISCFLSIKRMHQKWHNEKIVLKDFPSIFLRLSPRFISQNAKVWIFIMAQKVWFLEWEGNRWQVLASLTRWRHVSPVIKMGFLKGGPKNAWNASAFPQCLILHLPNAYISWNSSTLIDNNRHRWYTALIFGRSANQG